MLIFFIAVIIGLFHPTEGEYYIRDKDIPSVLYKKFNSVDEEVFPRDIIINMSLTRVSGTLLYSIDKNMNQLILTLDNSMEATLVIQINKQEFGVSLPQLCGCERCRFETFNLKVMMEETLNLQCNAGTFRRIKYHKTKALNEDYILPYNHKSNNSSTNEAHLWLVNNRQNGHITPNSNQISGCIFNVSYSGLEVEFTDISANVGRKCTKACKAEICNGGRCLETYNGEPYCNCTTTFMNGRYCNDSVGTQNLISTLPPLSFWMFKVSWQSFSTDIFKLENEIVRIRVYRTDNILTFEYTVLMKGGSITNGVSLENYFPEKKYILIGTFHESVIDINVYDIIVPFHVTLCTRRNLGKEIFTSMTLRSGNGTIGIVYKMSSMNTLWNNVPNTTYKDLQEEKERKGSDDKIKLTNTGTCMLKIILAAVVPSICGIVAVIGVVVYFKRNQPPPRPRQHPRQGEISFSNTLGELTYISIPQDEGPDDVEEGAKVDI